LVYVYHLCKAYLIDSQHLQLLVQLAHLDFGKVLITKHPLLSGDLFMYMAIIRGAISDATFDRVYMYDQQFRLRMSLNPTNSWSQIDGTLWLRFNAKGR
jgi:hypothetical protein